VPGIHTVRNELAVVHASGVPGDSDIKNHAEHMLKWNASVGARKINVGVASGYITLSGEVDAYWQRCRAESLMLDIQGVIAVVNKLEVIPDLIPQDRVIASDVKSAIARCACLDNDSISVEVEHGVVTLSGRVPSWWGKHNTPHLAASILGVKGVVDHLVVVR